MREHLSSAGIRRPLGRVATLLPLVLLTACSGAVLDPAGDVALQQRDIIYISTALMLVIIVPVLALVMTFAWRYRQANKDATYDPSFHHSTSLELVIWSAPLLIIICLGALTWLSTHLLDPFRPLNRVSATKAIDKSVRPLTVQVVSLDWKWLFIYPEQGIATVNELVLPVDRPVRFELTSTNMMNTFYAPTLAGMIYTMPGMRSTMHAVINNPGQYRGYSANYSGAGFSGMRFKLYGVDRAGFDGWVGRVKADRHQLTKWSFLALERPSEKVPALYFGQVEPGLFDRAYQRCMRPGTPCMGEIMAHDRATHGGPGAAMPAGHGSQPAAGQKPEGGLFKDDASDTGTHNTQPRNQNAPGSTEPASPKNRDMSLVIPAGQPRAEAA